ncbi:hypothetical protein P3102_32615 [Amycolatopsis sp. QT-25]|uniref:hypothetical protein n=1 Tax=Amycolatopsis sp. QT-25 TaxID=3034022 RepID=UPI0023EBD334|nr:hypothetical protein [Amycolatopsis sp. QT-25]WET78743.1 hypothetical protein P3102_32615 [Amycolatopsis sp. QT-25]
MPQQPVLRNAMKRAGAESGGYALRRGYATRAVEGGTDVLQVKRTMGHADLDELYGYEQEIPVSDDKLSAALGEPHLLKVVGQRGTKRETDRDDQALPDASTEK